VFTVVLTTVNTRWRCHLHFIAPQCTRTQVWSTHCNYAIAAGQQGFACAGTTHPHCRQPFTTLVPSWLNLWQWIKHGIPHSPTEKHTSTHHARPSVLAARVSANCSRRLAYHVYVIPDNIMPFGPHSKLPCRTATVRLKSMSCNRCIQPFYYDVSGRERGEDCHMQTLPLNVRGIAYQDKSQQPKATVDHTRDFHWQPSVIALFCMTHAGLRHHIPLALHLLVTVT
jgi:hypothetical protein